MSCIKCGREIDEPAGALLKDRQPCEDCGSLNRQVGLTFVSNSTGSSAFSLNVIRGMNPSRDRAFQVLLAFALAAAGFALTGFFWQAAVVALAGVSVACYWPQLEPRIAALMHWVRRQ